MNECCNKQCKSYNRNKADNCGKMIIITWCWFHESSSKKLDKRREFIDLSDRFNKLGKEILKVTIEPVVVWLNKIILKYTKEQ